MSAPIGNRLDMTQGGTDNSTKKYRADITAISDAKQAVAAGTKTGPTYDYEGGTPGYWVDNTGAINSQYAGQAADANNVYDQAAAALAQQNKGISQGFTQAKSQIDANSAARTKALSGMLAGDQNDAANWAAANGFSSAVGNAPAASARTKALVGVLNGNTKNQDTAWDQYFDTTGKTAQQRGQATIGLSDYNRKLLEDEINQAKAKALLTAIYYVGGSGGKKTKTGGYTAKQGAAANKKLDSAETGLISSVQNMLGTKAK